ncbi:MAG: antitoxin [Candidatus Methanomethylicota archaeon]|uniref:Antitoxin n=1 Tax=Thermoproteota archaeon TaxID=2056631 RepID=A0A497ET54_9CREN|nr:MAG: antitoxin [Candidatus Verstraetearchaeota archaeon]
MSTIVAIRVPKQLKEALEELGIDYSREVKEFLERRVREERLKRSIEKLEEFKRGLGKIDGNLAARFIREVRESR